MKSRTTPSFWRLFDDLPPEVQEHAREAYRIFAADPSHPGLHFKRVSKSEPIYSVRIGLAYRTLGKLRDNTVTWFWIGHHRDYDRMI